MIRDSLHFLKAALRSPTRVGAIVPSSPALAQRMMQGIHIPAGRTILELGPGTGPMTRVISRHLGREAGYLGIELDPKFVALLEQRYPHLRFVQGSAEHAAGHVRQARVRPVAAIISGLPFATLPTKVQEGILQSLEELMAPGVVFRTFQYMHAWMMPSAVRFRKRMNRRFGRCKVGKPVLANIPPAVVLSWEG